ncbi:MAG TPA: trypsin-like serine protease [Kofleriaceae bacterium]
MRRWLLALAPAAWVLPIATALAQPVTNGTAAAGDPAVIALVNASDQVICTAAVIGPHTAITAGHCVGGRDPRTLRIFIGSTLGEAGTFIAVSDARTHPQFDPGGRDIAMMTLRESAPVAPLELAGPVDASLVGTMIRVVGFGLTAGNLSDAGIKREGTARIAAVRTEELIAVPDPSLSCLGDSGGPALLPAGTIGGVVSRVDSLCVDHAVYTRIDIAQDPLIQPYLAETAPGAAGEGEPCFYAAHCTAGLECRGDAETFCESPAGCGCASTATATPAAFLVVLVVLVGLAIMRRRPVCVSARPR